MSRIRESAEQVSDSAEQVSNGAQALAQGATEQASSVQELSATISDISGETVFLRYAVMKKIHAMMTARLTREDQITVIKIWRLAQRGERHRHPI
mgnify:CR=1 FL=1